MQDPTRGLHRRAQRLAGALLAATLVAALSLLAGAGGAHAQNGGIRSTSVGHETGDTATHAPDGDGSRRMSRAYTVDARAVAPIPRTALIDEAVPSVRYHSLREVRFLGAVRRADVSHDLRFAPHEELLGVGADMCRMVQQFGGDPAAAELGLATALRDSGQASLVGEGDQLLKASVEYLCPPSP
jgi:hypothetical protein